MQKWLSECGEQTSRRRGTRTTDRTSGWLPKLVADPPAAAPRREEEDPLLRSDVAASSRRRRALSGGNVLGGSGSGTGRGAPPPSFAGAVDNNLAIPGSASTSLSGKTKSLVEEAQLGIGQSSMVRRKVVLSSGRKLVPTPTTAKTAIGGAASIGARRAAGQVDVPKFTTRPTGATTTPVQDAEKGCPLSWTTTATAVDANQVSTERNAASTSAANSVPSSRKNSFSFAAILAERAPFNSEQDDGEQVVLKEDTSSSSSDSAAAAAGGPGSALSSSRSSRRSSRESRASLGISKQQVRFSVKSGRLPEDLLDQEPSPDDDFEHDDETASMLQKAEATMQEKLKQVSSARRKSSGFTISGAYARPDFRGDTKALLEQDPIMRTSALAKGHAVSVVRARVELHAEVSGMNLQGDADEEGAAAGEADDLHGEKHGGSGSAADAEGQEAAEPLLSLAERVARAKALLEEKDYDDEEIGGSASGEGDGGSSSVEYHGKPSVVPGRSKTFGSGPFSGSPTEPSFRSLFDMEAIRKHMKQRSSGFDGNGDGTKGVKTTRSDSGTISSSSSSDLMLMDGVVAETGVENGVDFGVEGAREHLALAPSAVSTSARTTHQLHEVIAASNSRTDRPLPPNNRADSPSASTVVSLAPYVPENFVPAPTLPPQQSSTPTSTAPASAVSLAVTAAALQQSFMQPIPRFVPKSSTQIKGVDIAKNADLDYAAKKKKYDKKLNLAQKLNLQEKPDAPMDDTNWKKFQTPILERFKTEIDQKCPICIQPYGDPEKRVQVVLQPCGHVYHKNCLSSYEKFCEQAKCPLCRGEYSDCRRFGVDFCEEVFCEEARAPTDCEDSTASCSTPPGAAGCTDQKKNLLWRHQSATRLQRFYRAYVVRRDAWYFFSSTGTGDNTSQETRDATGVGRIRFFHPLNQQFRAPRLWQKTRLRLLAKEREKHTSNEEEVDNFLADVDSSVKEARRIMRECFGTGPTEEATVDQWKWAKEQCLARGFPDYECPICYVDLSQQGMGVALLSCGHAFHHCCVESFESFQTSKDDLKCPVCRQGPYQRKMWRFRGGGCRLKLDGTGCAEAGC